MSTSELITEGSTTGEKIAFILYSFLVLVPGGVLARALVISKLWLWFVATPLGVPAIGFATALGIGTLVSYLVHEWSEDKPKVEKPKMRMFEKAVEMTLKATIPLIVLFIGYLIHLFQ